MYDFAILEISEHLHDSVHFPDMRKEFIPQSFSLARSFHETGDINEFYTGIYFLFGLRYFRKHINPGILHIHDPYIRIYRTERKILRWRGIGFRKRIEKRGFSDIRHSNYSDFHNFFYKRLND